MTLCHGTIFHSTPGRHRSASRTALLAVAALLVLASAGAARAQLPSDWLAYTAVAKSKLVIGSNIEVSGNFAVIESGGEMSLGTNLFVNSDPPDSFLAADTIEFTGGASANNVFVNNLQLNNSGEVRGTITRPFPFPLDIDVPTLPPEIDSICTNNASNIRVGAGQTQMLTAGCYRDVFIDNDATIELTGGTYIFRNLSLDTRAQLKALQPAVLDIQNNIAAGIGALLFPESSIPADLIFNIKGKVNRFGNETFTIGRVIAPNDNDLEFGPRSVFIGNSFADGTIIFGVHQRRTPTPTPSATPKPTPTPTPTPPIVTPTPPLVTPTPPVVTPTPPLVTPTPPVVTPTPPLVTPTPPVVTPTPPLVTPTPPLVTPTPPIVTPTPPIVTPTPPLVTPTPPRVTPTPPLITPTPPRVTPTPPPTTTPPPPTFTPIRTGTPVPSPTPTAPFVPPTPTPKPSATPTPVVGTPTPTPKATVTPVVTPTSPFFPPTATPLPPNFRKHPWGRMFPLVPNSDLQRRDGGPPSMKMPLKRF